MTSWVASCDLCKNFPMYLMIRPHLYEILIALIICDILNCLYPVRKDTSFYNRLRSEVAKMELELQKWTVNLPDNLRLDSHEQVVEAPAHILCLHIQWESAATAVQLPL